MTRIIQIITENSFESPWVHSPNGVAEPAACGDLNDAAFYKDTPLLAAGNFIYVKYGIKTAK